MRRRKRPHNENKKYETIFSNLLRVPQVPQSSEVLKDVSYFFHYAAVLDYFATFTASSNRIESNVDASSEPSVTPYKISARDIVSRL